MERFDGDVGDYAVTEGNGEFAHAALGLFAVVFVFAVLLSPWIVPLARAAAKFAKECGKSWGLAILAAACILYGSTKAPTAEFRFDDGLVNAGSWQSNNTVHVEYTYLPEMANFYVFVDAQTKPATNAAGWVRMARTLVSDVPFEFTLQNASNYVFQIWSDYVPIPQELTNETVVVGGIMRGLAETNAWIAPKIESEDRTDDWDLAYGQWFGDTDADVWLVWKTQSAIVIWFDGETMKEGDKVTVELLDDELEQVRVAYATLDENKSVRLEWDIGENCLWTSKGWEDEN